MKYVFLLFLLVLSGGSQAQAPDVDTYYDGFFAPLVTQGKPVFFASCKLPHTRAILFFPMGEKEGKYAEFDQSGLQANGAAVELTVSNQVSVDDVMGGIAVRAAAIATINGLVKLRFQLVLPADLKKALTSPPETVCATN